jgi:hypothetical protein
VPFAVRGEGCDFGSSDALSVGDPSQAARGDAGDAEGDGVVSLQVVAAVFEKSE